MSRRPHRPITIGLQLLRSAAVVGLAAVVIGMLVWPMLFTTSGLGGDWEHHLWYVWQQDLAIRAGGAPSMFLNTSYSVFYPLYAFYGGTIYALAGTLAVVLGNSPTAAYILTYILGFAAAYGGWVWMGRSFGLGRWLAQVPALVFVTSACYLTLVYGEGDWPEFLAFSMLPLMLAAGLSVMHAERLRILPAAALAGSSIVFFGSHNLTVLWASTFFGLTCIVVVACVPGARQQLRGRGVVRVAALVIPAVFVNMWYLLPTIAYASHTRIGSHFGVAHEILRETMRIVAFDHLFTLSRATTVPEAPAYALPLPTLAIVWVLASIAVVLVNVRRGAWARMLLVIAAVTVGIVVLMTHAGLILALPQPYTLLQFSYRLEGYVLMGVAAAVMVILVLVQSGSRRLALWRWTIVPVLIASAIGAIQQVSAYPHTRQSRDLTLTYRGEVFARAYNDYAYVPLPFVSERRLPKLYISPAQMHGNRASLAVRARPGQLVASNIEGGPNLLHITGASIAGTDERSQLVLAIGSAAGAGSANPRTPLSAEHISISPAQSVPVVLGRTLTVLGAAVLTLELVLLSARGYRRTREKASVRSSPSTVVCSE